MSWLLSMEVRSLVAGAAARHGGVLRYSATRSSPIFSTKQALPIMHCFKKAIVSRDAAAQSANRL